jgi:NitT/TauT family transport system ATP-binding protein
MQSLAAVSLAADTAPPVISVDGLTHIYQARGAATPALANISLQVADGQFTVIVGPSGCGKSSLLMMMAGLRHQTAGTILIGGQPLTDPDPDRVGVVFQEANLFPWLTAAGNVAFPLALRGTPRSEQERRVREMLMLVGLGGAGERFPHELSGGMKQRVSIARGLVQDPPVLLMDEPFAALDEITRDRMGIELMRIHARFRKTVLFVTHSLAEAVFLSDAIVLMTPRPGRIERVITVDLPRPRLPEMRLTDAFARMVAELNRELYRMMA